MEQWLPWGKVDEWVHMRDRLGLGAAVLGAADLTLAVSLL